MPKSRKPKELNKMSSAELAFELRKSMKEVRQGMKTIEKQVLNLADIVGVDRQLILETLGRKKKP